MTLSVPDLTVTEGEADGKTSTYTVVLTNQPDSNVGRPDGTVGIGITFSNPDKVSVSPSWLIFDGTQFPNNPVWNVPQTVTVTALDDADSDHETVTLTHTINHVNVTPGTWCLAEGTQVGTVTVTVNDNKSN